MPTLFEETEIQDALLSEIDLQFWIWCRVYSTMLFPGLDEKSEVERRRAHATFAAAAMPGDLDAPLPAIVQSARRELQQAWRKLHLEVRVNRWVQLHLAPLGDRKTLAESNSLDDYIGAIRNAVPSWERIGKVMLVVRMAQSNHTEQLRGGASLSKAIDFVENASGVSRSKIFKEWEALRPIAHLCSALVHPTSCPQHFNSLAVPREIPLLLFAAKDFENFGSKFVQIHGAKPHVPLLPSERVWNIPVESPQDWSLKYGPFLPTQLKWITARQAAKRIG